MSKINRVGIFGTSGMAREAGDIASALRLEPIYVARDASDLQTWPVDAPVFIEAEIEQYSHLPFVIGIAESNIRRTIVEQYSQVLRFINIVHPSATFGAAQRDLLEKSRGTIIAAGVRFTSGISVGDFCIFNQNATIAHDCDIGSFVHIAPGANISGNVQLQNGCWIGAGAVVNQGTFKEKLRIGANTTVGSGAVVVGDCEPDAVYVGVPAKRIK